MTQKSKKVRHQYAWLGAGAITLGIGAALASGSAVAVADTGQSGSTSGSTGASNSSSAASSKSTASRSHSRPQAGTVASSSNHAVAAGPARTAATAGPAASVSPAAPGARASRPAAVKPKATAVAQATGTGTETPKDTWGNESYLPDNQVIVPGAAVKLALEQIAAAQSLLQAQTWGSGNVVAGLVSLVPQALLAQSAWSLTTWQNSIDGAQAAVANTENIPVAHQVAQLSLLGTLMLPSLAGVTLSAAAQSVPLVGLFGASTAATQAAGLIGQAQQNGQVYAVRLLRTVETTQQIIYISVNGGPVVPVQLDTGSSGLSILNKYVGQKNLGPATGSGHSGYGDDTVSVGYDYHTYQTTIDFGNGAITAPANIMIVDPESEAAYDNYSVAGIGVAGTLGIAANSGSGPTLNALLPGELKDGVMLYQNIIGSYGLVVFGPNPLPSRGSVNGAPIGDVRVQINDGALQPLKTNIDSGGVYGGLPSSVAGSAQSGSGLKPGTRVSVYTADGLTLLYTYTITDSNSPNVYDDTTANSSRPNTGNIPFGLGPIYLDYSPAGGLGATHFDIV
ncbi:PecA family PE domain-processing aspartic protease [Mycolicibacterium komossense]|uniref:PecA family PE domain-processing aspartic protease n=1 Tax=Mycolicibacterium komossense TaxID=1779 RepID=A0ABT3CFH5_9MYCO|nr:PecA family PE domain-processing aspartic protease [Mycolicibacterium komossense]MCV7228233.1 PecA family PE domain-processing aspartic protease [Mycolicibacterium komossense]